MPMRMGSRRGLALLLALGVLSQACGRDEPFQARFAVRGRWPGERALGYRIDPEGGPLAPAEFRRAIRSALDEWSATGCASFHEAPAGAEPALTFSWQRGAHGECVPFGTDPGVAHAGPVGPGTFVHFDAGRDWSARELSLRQAALHEVGHVLGLDHSPDEAAALYPEPSPARDRLARSDLAGIHSLYGGGSRAPGDLVVEGGGGTLTLHAVAPRALARWALFDTDGDGDAEVLVWRTDPAGHGALWSFHFARGPRLARTLGPLYGVAAPGLEFEPVRTARGERLLVLVGERGPLQARILDAAGLPRLFEGELPPLPGPPAERSDLLQGDLDGDGGVETVTRRP
jgi:hypothetical protein